MFAILIRSVLTTIVSFFGFELMVNHKNLLFWIAFFYLLFLFFFTLSVIQICKIKSNRLHYVIFPILCNLSAIIFFVFIPGKIFQQIYIIICSFLFGTLLFYVGNFILGYVQAKKFLRHYTLFDVIVLSCSFLSYTALFGLYLFLSWPTWLLLLLALFMSLFLLYYYFWYNKLTYKKNLLHYFIFSLVVAEAAWAVTFWSTGYLSRGIVLFILFYLFSGFLKHYYQKTLNKKIIKEYLVTSIIVLGLILGTTKWTF